MASETPNHHLVTGLWANLLTWTSATVLVPASFPNSRLSLTMLRECRVREHLIELYSSCLETTGSLSESVQVRSGSAQPQAGVGLGHKEEMSCLSVDLQ